MANETVFLALGLTQPNRITQVRNDAYQIYSDFIAIRNEQEIRLARRVIANHYGWTILRAKKAIERLRKAEIIVVVKKANKLLLQTTVYKSEFGVIKDFEPEMASEPIEDNASSWLDDALDTMYYGSNASPAVDYAIYEMQDRGIKNLSKNAVARLLNMPRTTVRRAIDELLSHGLASYVMGKLTVVGVDF